MDFDGKKVQFYLVGNDEDLGTKKHRGGKYLTRDVSGLLKNKQQFIGKEHFGHIERESLFHNIQTYSREKIYPILIPMTIKNYYLFIHFLGIATME